MPPQFFSKSLRDHSLRAPANQAGGKRHTPLGDYGANRHKMKGMDMTMMDHVTRSDRDPTLTSHDRLRIQLGYEAQVLADHNGTTPGAEALKIVRRMIAYEARRLADRNGTTPGAEALKIIRRIKDGW